MKKILMATTALGFLALLGVPQNAEARTYFSLQFGGPTYVAPYYVAPQPYYVAPAPTYVVPQYYYSPPPRHFVRVPEYTPWGVVYHTEYY